uniref:Tudor domain-containing protein n=1 Tax=Plectus sambesii TaxID=2011161 RepID=A0A914XM69_9BILA
MATISHALSASSPVAVFRQEWTICVDAVDVILKKLERLPSETVHGVRIETELNTLTAMVQRVAELTGDVLAALPPSPNRRVSPDPIRRPNQTAPDMDLIKFDDSDSHSVVTSTAFDLPAIASSTAKDFVTNFFQPSSNQNTSSALAEVEQQEQIPEMFENAVAEQLSLTTEPANINRQRLSSASNPSDADNQIVNYAFKNWEFARPRTYKYLSFETKIGEKIPAHMGFVESPALFFVMPDANNEIYEALEEQLQLFGELLASEKIILQSPRVGQPCIARFETDKLFYRGIVTSVGNDDCHIQYVDFGNTEFIPNGELYPLPVDLLDAPCAVLKCSIYQLDTRDLTTDVREDFLRRVHEGDPAVVELSALTNPAAAPSEREYRVLLYNTDGNMVTWQKQKQSAPRRELDIVTINLSAQGGETEEGNLDQARDQETVSAVGNITESAPVGDLLGMGGSTPELTAEEELKRVLAISMLEY